MWDIFFILFHRDGERKENYQRGMLNQCKDTMKKIDSPID